MRHSDRAVQMPTSASGNRLCRHGIVGGCTRFCSYKLFARVIAAAVVVLGLVCVGIWVSGGEGRVRVHEMVYGVGAYLALVIHGIVIANSRERE
jgi:inner membrane protein involved in colicin E2 resistance